MLLPIILCSPTPSTCAQSAMFPMATLGTAKSSILHPSQQVGGFMSYFHPLGCVCQPTPEMKVCKDLYWIYSWLDCQEAILPPFQFEDCPSTSSEQHTCIHSQQKILALPLTTARKETRSAAVQHSGCK